MSTLTLPNQCRPALAAAPHVAVEADRLKDASIETLRGLAVLLMVLGHVIGNAADRGLRVEDDSAYRWVYYSFQDVRMPLFTVISGFVYAMRPVRLPSAGRFLRGKARRLLLPLFTVATLQFALQHVAAGTNRVDQWADLWKVYVYGFDQFWFLQALAQIFLTIVILDGFGLMATELAWLACLAAAGLASHYFPKSDLFSFWGYLYLLPYFLLGCGLQRFPEFLCRRPVLLTIGLLLAGGLALQQAEWFGDLGIDLEQTGWLALCVGLTGTALLFRFRQPMPWLATLGTYSFSIYLFHVFGTAGSRVVLSQLGLESRPALIVAGLAAGVCLPIAAELVLKQNRVLRTAFLGLK
jgi:peptidoglycan/LPS O-acetylase OafA/YrhL